MPNKDLTKFVNESININEAGGPYLTRVITSGQKQGFHYRELWNAIKVAACQPGVCKFWSNWEMLQDREEIRLRLKVLAETETFDSSLTEFVCFFFRASDPVLYQLAAMIIGREMQNSSKLREYIEQYARKRKVNLRAPIQLKNQRTYRRLMLVIASYLSYAKETDDYPIPFIPKPDDTSKLMSDSDIIITFISFSILLKSGFTECQKEVVALLEKRINSDKRIQERSLIRATGLLLSALNENGKNIDTKFIKTLKRSNDQYLASHETATKLQTLFLTDELMETAVHLKYKEDWLITETSAPQELIQFMKFRYSYWREMYRTSEKTVGKNKTNQNELSYSSVEGEKIFTEKSYSKFAGLVHLLSDEPAWRSYDVEDRAFKAFQVIDQSINTARMNAEELELLIESCGLTEKKVSRNHEQGMIRQSVFAPIMKRLIELEPSVLRHMPDAQLIHRLSDPSMLPVIMPSNQDSEFLPVLADAVEHQLRFCLATDTNFEPDTFLYTLSIRKPHPRFYSYLLELCRDREYLTKNGQTYPLTQEVLHIITELKRYGQDKLTDSSTPLNEPISSTALNPDAPAKTHFSIALTDMRKNLENHCREKDLWKLFNILLRELRGTGAEQVRSEITLHDLLEIVQPSGTGWYRSGKIPYTTEAGSKNLNELLELADKVEAKMQLIYPPTLNIHPIYSESVQSLQAYIKKIQFILFPLLGKLEALLFDRFLNHLSARLSLWEREFTGISQCHEENLNLSSGKDLVFERINDIQHKHIQIKLLQLYWETELHNIGAIDKANWIEHYDLLYWAASKTQELPAGTEETKELWLQLLEKQWLILLREAMETYAEARVTQLIRVNMFLELRRRPAIQNLLTDVRQWFLNRYDYFHALQCNRVTFGQGNPLIDPLRTAGQYFTFFAPVWLALLLGVIFMFDFGDPWFELAEIGDVGGVLFAFLLGVTGTFLYVWYDLRSKTVQFKNDSFYRISVISRVTTFLLLTFLYTLLVVSLFWYMFSSTDQVVHGPNAYLHLLSWTGFALFVGVFLGLLGRSDG